MNNTEIAKKIMRGLTVSLTAEDKDEEEIEKLTKYFRGIMIKVNCTIMFLHAGGCKVTMIIPPIEMRLRSLVLSALNQSKLNLTPYHA